jgi:prepilin-type N-terminal cleavage/methylation domain-containing protein
MDCKITYSIKRNRCAAVTLLELMVAMVIGSLALTAVSLLSIYTIRSFTALSNYMELDKNSRNTLDQMTKLIREADGVLDYDNHFVTLSYHAQPLSFSYSPSTKELTMTQTNGVKKVLLEDCGFLDFQIFQRNSISGTYDQYPATATESAAKIVQISWICSKHLIGTLINSESVQSAKIVIRKQ